MQFTARLVACHAKVVAAAPYPLSPDSFGLLFVIRLNILATRPGDGFLWVGNPQRFPQGHFFAPARLSQARMLLRRQPLEGLSAQRRILHARHNRTRGNECLPKRGSAF